VTASSSTSFNVVHIFESQVEDAVIMFACYVTRATAYI
jgi:hypothetical protein